jgi:hypothetical protein
LIEMSENGITIELYEDQIDRVVREAGQDNGLLGLVGGIEDLVEFRASPAQLDDPRLSRSLLRGLMVLGCFPADGAGREVTDVARELEMGGSTTHRYATTLLEVGLLERDPASREYRRAARG